MTKPVKEVLIGDERVVGGQLEDVLMSLGSSQGAKPAPWVLDQCTTQNNYVFYVLLPYIHAHFPNLPDFSRDQGRMYRQTPIFRHPFSLKYVLVAPHQNFWRFV